MTDNEIIKAFDVLEKMEFFGGQRAGRELWFNKPIDIQNKDIGKFLRDIDFLKTFINSQQAEIERLQKDKSEWAHLPCKVGTQVFFLRDKNNIVETSVEKIIFKGKDGKGCYIKLECNAMYETSCQSIGKTVFFTRESAEKALAERRKH